MCTTFVAKVVVSIVNTLVFLVGLIMFIIGLLIHTQPEFSQKALGDLLDQLEDTASSAGVTIDTSEFSVAEVAYSFTVAIMVFGLFLATISLLGLIGVKYSLKPVLIVYFIITLVLFLAQVTLIMMAVIDRSVFDSTVKPRLKDTIEDYYEGLESNDGTSQVWNGVMAKLKCCGVDDYKDFKNCKKWKKKEADLETPIPCCKNVTSNYACAKNPVLDSDNNYDKGCYEEIWTFLISNSGIAVGIAAGVLCAQLVLLLLTCMIMNSLNKIDTIV